MITVPMKVSVQRRVEIPFRIAAEYKPDLWEYYTGETEIYPTDYTQILETEEKIVPKDITIYPYPVFPLQNKAVEPSVHEDLDIKADSGYYGLDTVTVLKVPYEETDNKLGGKTVKIGQ